MIRYKEILLYHCREEIMELSRESLFPLIESHLELVRDNTSRTFIVQLRKHVSLEWMEQIWREVCAYPRIEQKIHSEILEIIAEDQGIVLQIENVAEIAKYCERESVHELEHKWIQREIVRKDWVDKEFSVPLSFEIQSEILKTDTKEDDHWDNLEKYYRLRKLFEYILPENQGIIQIEHIRSATSASTKMKTSNVTNVPVEYAVRFIVPVENDLEKITKNIVRFVQIITDDMFPISKTQQENVLAEYRSILKLLLHNPRQSMETFMFGPKPVTLERIHLQDPFEAAERIAYGGVSILTGYAVTAKADGERMLMYIDNSGLLFSINNTLDVKYTGWKTNASKLHNSLFDGEWVSFNKRRDDVKRDLFLGFDAYVVNKEVLTKYSLLGDSKDTTRMKKLEAILDEDLWIAENAQHTVELKIKEHIHKEGEEMFEACRKILESAKSVENFNYTIDGLIFTPYDVPVFGYYPKTPVNITENMSWTRVLKWKPSDQNTIDFLVKEKTKLYTEIGTGKSFRIFQLNVGYNRKQWEPISPWEGLRLRYDRDYKREMNQFKKEYIAHEFTPISFAEPGVNEAWLPVRGDIVTADNGDGIRNESIVEFAYDVSAIDVPPYKRWKPLRVRDDKTRKYQQEMRTNPKKMPSKTANDYSVAMNIWRSIHEPVTEGMICGEVKVPQSMTTDERLSVDDTYYARDVPRQHMLSVHMLNFHNLGVKEYLYNFSKTKESILELACGMAGDMHRWEKYNFVLGIDLVRNNITHPREGSWARILRNRTPQSNTLEKTKYLDTVFVVGDCGKNLKDGTAARAAEDQDSEQILRLVYNRGAVPRDKQYMKYVIGKAVKGFNVVSCQFAIHYFFESEGSLNGFLQNVSENLRKGGIFITTFMDGKSVHEKLNGHLKCEGRKLGGKVPVWAILKKYQTYIPALNDVYGKKIDVFLENTNQAIGEYLVDVNTLTNKAIQYNLRVLETESFGETFHKLKNANNNNDRLQDALNVLANDPIQSEFSFLNRWMIFQKE